MKMTKKYQSIVELSDFVTFAQKHLNWSEYDDLLFFLANNPEAGDIIIGTGGVRKLRWAAKGKGKSGGVRVIYYYHNENIPLFLIAGYAKSNKANLSPTEKNTVRKLVSALVEIYRSKKHDKK